jgi:hypothetical protein
MKQAAERLSRRPSPAKQLRQLGDVGGDAPGLVAGQTDSSPSMPGIALLMPVNRAGAVEYEIDENNGIKA